MVCQSQPRHGNVAAGHSKICEWSRTILASCKAKKTTVGPTRRCEHAFFGHSVAEAKAALAVSCGTAGGSQSFRGEE